MALRISLIFCISVEDIRAHRLSQMVFPKKILNPTFLSFSQNGSKDLPNFLQEGIGPKGPSFEPDIFFLKKVLITDYRVFIVKGWCFGGSTSKRCYDGSILACLYVYSFLRNKSDNLNFYSSLRFQYMLFFILSFLQFSNELFKMKWHHNPITCCCC